MLSFEPHEFFAGTLADAKPGSMLLPRTDRETNAYIGTSGDKPFAILLSGEHKFHSLDAEANENWRGILIPNAKILVDPESALDPRAIDPRPGMVVRLLNKLSVWALRSSRLSHDMMRIDLATDLPPCCSDLQVGFLHWQVVLESEKSHRVLFDVDLRQKIQDV